ncbi:MULTISPECIES: SapC family protein [unclassified Microbulbifer]|uniref:SapC family protein n=1 Tax=unclassified Microbulbifer TaxID=2619833 RepID=UPI0027E425D8|nr:MULTISPECIES: SapC family protein [unclassified Microbulbifer]
MARLVALNSELHRDIRIDTAGIERQAASLRMVPVMPSEFLKLAIDYPIVLTKNAETGRFVCAALFGFAEGENLYWNGDRWQSLYTPLNIIRQPFFVGTDENSQPLVCIDEDSPCVQRQPGRESTEALFDDEGRGSPYLERMQGVLGQLLDGEKQSEELVRCLQELELITPMRLEVTFASGDFRRVEGLYTVDEEKLRGLGGEPLQQLSAAGMLGHIYSMLTSLGHIYSLIERKNAREAAVAES